MFVKTISIVPKSSQCQIELQHQAVASEAVGENMWGGGKVGFCEHIEGATYI